MGSGCQEVPWSLVTPNSPWVKQLCDVTATSADCLHPKHHLASFASLFRNQNHRASGLISYMQQRLSVINTSSSPSSPFIIVTPAGNPNPALQLDTRQSPNISPEWDQPLNTHSPQCPPPPLLLKWFKVREIVIKAVEVGWTDKRR